MKSSRTRTVVALWFCIGLMTACAPKADYSARFLRYATLPDGTRVAVVAPIAQQDEAQTAYTDIQDLKLNERVLVHVVGRSWEMAQWVPEREIVSRTSQQP